jgi:hypothetical protein
MCKLNSKKWKNSLLAKKKLLHDWLVQITFVLFADILIKQSFKANFEIVFLFV